MEIPRNPVAYFLFGAFCMGFLGFWTGGAHTQASAANADAEVFQNGVKQAEGVVYTSYSSGEGGSYDVDYVFAIQTGQIFQGTYGSDLYVQKGTRIRVAYAASDPTVSHETQHSSPTGVSPLFEWFGALSGVVVMIVMVKLAFPQIGAAPGLKLTFFLFGTALFATGIVLGLQQHQNRYTVQLENMAWCSRSFTNDFIPGVRLRLDESGLKVNGKYYGNVPNHAHIWLKDDGVYVNNVLRH